MQRTGNRTDRDAAYDLFPKLRVFANVLNRATPDTGPVILAFGKTIYDALMALRLDEDSGGDFTHPDTGFDITIERKGTGKMDTEYTVRPARRSTALTDMSLIELQGEHAHFAAPPDEDGLADIIDRVAESRGLGNARQPAAPRSLAPQTRPRRTADTDLMGSEAVDAEIIEE